MILDPAFIVKDLELYINENADTHYLVMEHCPYPSIELIFLSKTR